ncbi:IMS-domain-containing protein [Mycena metata]|uniref:DNA polymerase kappa n=1 Tax=Mycena metata TaxID=1033252 RepID=A0AAD7KEG0_9AGAR|nr:IMS-domain-containing protein [Mycena metata]
MSMPAEPPPSQETASLVKRLAGPSTGKAGLAKDQEDINRIIADVSKGSRFYENEKKKDKELTKKIEHILHLRDELTQRPGVDLLKIEASLRKLESERDLSQTIVHFDLDSFFASVEVLNDPTLAGKPFIVGGSVVSTASYEARKYGVRSGMASFIAKKLCPQLISISHGYSDYSEMSQKVMSICKRYDPSLCPAGCDEGYLNITAYCAEHDLSADECVQHLRSAVFAETKLTVSAGIAANTNKPNGQFHLPFNSEAITSFMRDLPIRRVPGIGRVSERLLESIGIKTCGDIYTYRATISLMDKQFGLLHLLRTHLGIASNSVQPPQREERKSIGAERTFPPLADKQKILEKLNEVCAELESDMEETQWTGRTITLKYKLDSFEVFTRAKSHNRWISKKEDLFAVGQELLLPELPLSIRLIGLRVTKLKDLREPDPSIGIKRFFETTNSSSPNKKRKVSPSGQDELNADPPTEDETLATLLPQHQPDGPQNARPTSSRSVKPDPEAPRETHTYICPVCEKEVTIENQTLNEHLDLCLNRNAIRQAQGEVKPVRAPPKQGDIWERWTKKASGSKKRT